MFEYLCILTIFIFLYKLNRLQSFQGSYFEVFQNNDIYQTSETVKNFG